ncbi:C-X-C chemokine receptor type 5 [Leuresthes tenuis]|uniref:C-X-C chemokine receptor type 5 n=1 Tax=Leuresthes tenuis TaxID=355514 RepID=UPI003B508FF8
MGDYENYTDYNETSDCDDESKVMESFNTMFLPAFYSVIFLLGLTGNGLMITVLLRRRRLRITEIYLLHLALADLLLLFTLPFDVVEIFAGWVFGELLCIVKGLIKNLNIFSGSFLLACIGFDRYLAIVHAIPSMQTRRPRTVHLTCFSLWLVCLLLSLPNAAFLSVRDPANTSALECYYFRFDVNAHNWVMANRILHHVCFFYCLAVMCYCYTALVITLSRSHKSQIKKGAVRLAALVTLVFCVCWLPYNITSLVQTLAELELMRYDSCKSFTYLFQAIAVTESLGVSHCCLNPFLYAFVGVQFRSDLIYLLCQLGCSRICLPFIRVGSHSRVSISEGTTSNSNFNN